VLNSYLSWFEDIPKLEKIINLKNPIHFKFDIKSHIEIKTDSVFVKRSLTFIDGFLSKIEEYHINGTKAIEDNYGYLYDKDNNLRETICEGFQYGWYKNGNKKYQLNFINGVRDGK
jgi:hypothetical protein